MFAHRILRRRVRIATKCAHTTDPNMASFKFALASTMAVGALVGASDAAQTKYEELRKDQYYYHRNNDVVTAPFTVPYAAYKRWRSKPDQK